MQAAHQREMQSRCWVVMGMCRHQWAMKEQLCAVLVPRSLCVLMRMQLGPGFEALYGRGARVPY